ncbi:MAG: efflux RND transporter periplasmic adaptor subunit [Akkermansiaceae bacterium]|nr:efflux RND transporter periplasmic adaptor subunit [Akkermansiaceae bacterium]
MKASNIVMMALGGLVACTTLVACKDNAGAQAAQRGMTPINVTVMPLQKRTVDLTSTWFGHLRGVDQADIRPEVSGKLLEQVYWHGSLCEKDEVLFRIDPSNYQAAYDQALANVAAAKAGVLQAQVADEQAQKDLERFSALVESGSVSEKQFTDAQHAKRRCEAALAMARAQEAQAEAATVMARLNLERCTIRAPFKGLATKSNVSVGDFVAAGQVVMTRMSSIDPIRVDFSVPARQMSQQAQGEEYYDLPDKMSPVKEFDLILEDGSVFEHKGTVHAVDSEISQSTGTVKFVGYVPNPQLKLRAGAAVRVQARTGEIKDALLVPSRALVSSMNHRFIYVVAPDNTPLGIDVKLGKELVLDMPNGDGTVVPMLMQVVTGTVKPIAETLKEAGIENVEDAQVIVGGGQMAAQYALANAGMRKAGAQDGFGTVVPQPFIYEKPATTVESVTTDNDAE